MSCNLAWDRAFLTKTVPKSWLSSKYKIWREEVLFESELGKMPATQQFVDIRFQIGEEREKINKIELKIAELRNSMRPMFDNIKQLELQYHTLKPEAKREFIRNCPSNTCNGFLSSGLKCKVCGINTCKDCNEIKTQDIEHTCDPALLENIQFIRADSKPCPRCSVPIFKIAGCFAPDTPILMWDQTIKMSQDIENGDILIGDDAQPRTVLNTCSGEDHMYEISQNNGENYIVNSKHTLVLKQDDLEVQIIVEDYLGLSENTRNTLHGFKTSGEKSLIKVIPIGIGSYYGWEIDGNNKFVGTDFTVLRNCNQMWCVNCNTAFDWVSLRIETGIVHNPHYFEVLRRNGGVVPRNPADRANCGRTFDGFVHRIPGHAFLKLTRIYDLLADINYRVAANYTVRRNFGEYRYQREEYILGNLKREEFKIILQRDEKKHLKHQEIRNVFDMFKECSTDILYKVEFENRQDIAPELIEELRTLVNYANDCFAGIAKTYSSSAISLKYIF
jgi:hypothetical protein